MDRAPQGCDPTGSKGAERCEPACDEVGHFEQVMGGEVAAVLGFGRLDQEVDPLREPVREAAGEPSQHTSCMIHQDPGDLGHGLEPKMDHHLAPVGQELGGCLLVRLHIEILERQPLPEDLGVVEVEALELCQAIPLPKA